MPDMLGLQHIPPKFSLGVKQRWNTIAQTCLIYTLCLSLCSASMNLKETFESEKLVPDIIPHAPEAVLEATYKNIDVKLGDTLTVEQTKDQPQLKWPDKPTYHTIIMTDPDSPDPNDPRLKELQHWIVGNIYKGNLSSGETFVEYSGPRDHEDYVVEKGKHRYVISVFEQIGRLIFAERLIENDNMLMRGLFSTRSFVDMYRLRGPIAATFFNVDHTTNSTSSKPKQL